MSYIVDQVYVVDLAGFLSVEQAPEHTSTTTSLVCFLFDFSGSGFVVCFLYTMGVHPYSSSSKLSQAAAVNCCWEEVQLVVHQMPN